ncbi:cyclophilin-like fold protein [Streptomyces violaceus]|nr:cyclophilin-like fold protein [Streptomyces violaceus]
MRSECLSPVVSVAAPRRFRRRERMTDQTAAGNIAYWSPGSDIAIFYDHDGQSIPDPGIVVLGEIGSGADALKKYDGTVDVTIEVVD